MPHFGRPPASAVRGGAILALLMLLVFPGTARADVTVGSVSPFGAPAGATVLISVDACADVPASAVGVFFRPAGSPDEGTAALARYPVTDATGGYALQVPPLAAGPYDLLVQCGDVLGSQPFRFSPEAAGPMFWITEPVGPGNLAMVFAFFPCGDFDTVPPAWADTRILLGPDADIGEPGDRRLVEAAVVDRGRWLNEGFLVAFRVPEITPGGYYVYSSCGDTFQLLGMTFGDPPPPWVTVLPDTSTVPVTVSQPGSAAGAPVVAVLAGLLAGLMVLAGGRRSRGPI